MIADFDLDCGHAGEVDWDGFYRACVDDPPIRPVINVMRALHIAGARIEVWSGRSDLVREETLQWFTQYGVPWVELRMRKHGDHGSDVDLKRGWLYECDSVPDLVFEDRDRVVRMFREEGIRVCQVADGDF